MYPVHVTYLGAPGPKARYGLPDALILCVFAVAASQIHEAREVVEGSRRYVICLVE